MKQLILISALTLAGCVGSLVHPFYGVLLYYTFALLQPQDLWRWALPEGIRWSVIAAAAAMFGTLLALPTIIHRIRWNLIASLLVAFGVCIAISALNAMDAQTAGWWGMLMAKVLAMTLVASLTIHSVGHVRWTVWMIFLVLGYLAFEVNFMYFFQGGRVDMMRRGHGGMDNNGFGLLIALGLPFAHAVAQTSRKLIVKLGCLAVALMILHAVMMSFSRTSMLCAMLGAAWILLHHRPRWQATGLGVVGLLTVLSLAGPEIRERFDSITRYDDDGSAQSRLDSWAAAWQITWDHPLTGVGVRNANILSKNYGADVYGRTIHNQYLQTSADLGVPAALIYIATCVAAIWRTTRLRWRCLPPPAADALPLHDDLTVARHEVAGYALAVQTAMVMFCFGAFFLSLESFELSWLLMVLAGVLPQIGDTVVARSAAPSSPNLPPLHAAPLANPLPA